MPGSARTTGSKDSPYSAVDPSRKQTGDEPYERTESPPPMMVLDRRREEEGAEEGRRVIQRKAARNTLRVDVPQHGGVVKRELRRRSDGDGDEEMRDGEGEDDDDKNSVDRVSLGY